MRKVEEGYVRVPNGLFQILSFVSIKPSVLKTFFAIYRLTLGWGTPERVLSYDNITLLTGLTRWKQYFAVKDALKMKLIKRYNLRSESEVDKPPVYVYSVNCNAKKWEVAIKITPEHYIKLWFYKMSLKKGTEVSLKKGTGMSLKKGTDVIDLLINNQIR